MRVHVDPAASEPLAVQIAAAYRSAVVDGRIAYGERLPPARLVAEDAGVDVHTVLRAYRMLRDEGFIDLRRGRGATVAKRLGHHTALAGAIHDLVDEARANGVDEPTLVALVRAAYR